MERPAITAFTAQLGGATTVDPASTCRRLQRFFPHVRREEDWAAPLLAGVAGGAEKRTLIIDRTNWKAGGNQHEPVRSGRQSPAFAGAADVNGAGQGGNIGHGGTYRPDPALHRLLWQHTIKILLADREFVGGHWFNDLTYNDIPFDIRLPNNRIVTLENGRKPYLADMITLPGKGRRITATLNGTTKLLILAAVTLKGRKNRPGPKRPAATVSGKLF